MQEVRTIAQAALQSVQQGKAQQTRKSLPAHWIAALFVKFRGRYSHKWTSRYPTDEEYAIAQKEWGEVLADVRPEQLKAGIDNWEGDFPPDAPQFKRWCKGQIVQAAHKHYKALPKPTPDPVVARQYLDKILEQLK